MAKKTTQKEFSGVAMILGVRKQVTIQAKTKSEAIEKFKELYPDSSVPNLN